MSIPYNLVNVSGFFLNGLRYWRIPRNLRATKTILFPNTLQINGNEAMPFKNFVEQKL
jgi:hypothetical protein